MVRVVALNHAGFQRGEYIDATRQQGCDERSIHRVLVEVQQRRHDLTPAVLSCSASSAAASSAAISASMTT